MVLPPIRATRSRTVLLTPYGIGLILGAVPGGIGAVVFLAVAMPIRGLVALISFARGT